MIEIKSRPRFYLVSLLHYTFLFSVNPAAVVINVFFFRETKRALLQQQTFAFFSLDDIFLDVCFIIAIEFIEEK